MAPLDFALAQAICRDLQALTRAVQLPRSRKSKAGRRAGPFVAKFRVEFKQIFTFQADCS
jgi:hypothetical protein